MPLYYYECIANNEIIGRTSPFQLYKYESIDLKEEKENIVERWCKNHPDQVRPSYYYQLRTLD